MSHFVGEANDLARSLTHQRKTCGEDPLVQALARGAVGPARTISAWKEIGTACRPESTAHGAGKRASGERITDIILVGGARPTRTRGRARQP